MNLHIHDYVPCDHCNGIAIPEAWYKYTVNLNLLYICLDCYELTKDHIVVHDNDAMDFLVDIASSKGFRILWFPF